MTGHELIKVYDGVRHHISSELLEALESANTTLEKVEEGVGDVLRDFVKTYPALTKNWTEGLVLDSVEILERHTQGRTYHDDPNIVGTVIHTLDSGHHIDFPLQGITFEGRADRFLAFPAFWTHPYQVMGEGKYLRLQLRRTMSPWSECPLSSKGALGGNHLITV